MQENIPGVYNYCDRWCERCPFTARCAVFGMDRDLDAGASDPEDAQFAEAISSRLTGALTLLQEAAGRWGLELEEPTPEEAAACAAREASIEEALDGSPLLEACTEFADTVELLFADLEAWDSQGRELARAAALGIKTIDEGLAEIELLADCRHVLGWYQYFIGVKFRRALHGRYSHDEEDMGLQCDSNGSAKVALLAVDRSRLALTTLLRLFSNEDRILGLLGLLGRIERLGREAFPDAEHFCRPGFDEQPAIANV
ncbi:hypothetical protein EPD60_12685 [Flaviaesturariibacter flavus]|uniref:Uncharacterized protein n=1 Tax=Flaviaesturariibacter flavus TaxID=2502780 RepID=A0A4R1B7V4_9BACT|nr:hypothetical protein [Flaviaesturariibacter flavus]TCJ13247.1 hypothetical protein EPD60_12685 [Flaviaesturariibacter flavus]